MIKEHVTKVDNFTRKIGDENISSLKKAIFFKIVILVVLISFWSMNLAKIVQQDITAKDLVKSGALYMNIYLDENRDYLADLAKEKAPDVMLQLEQKSYEVLPQLMSNLREQIDNGIPPMSARFEESVANEFRQLMGKMREDIQRARPGFSDEDVFNEVVSFKKGSPMRKQVLDQMFDACGGGLAKLNAEFKRLDANHTLNEEEKAQKALLGIWIKLVEQHANNRGT